MKSEGLVTIVGRTKAARWYPASATETIDAKPNLTSKNEELK